MLERRQIPRTEIQKIARIIFNRPGVLVDCTVLNVTNVGACLRVAASLEIEVRASLTLS